MPMVPSAWLIHGDDDGTVLAKSKATDHCVLISITNENKTLFAKVTFPQNVWR